MWLTVSRQDKPIGLLLDKYGADGVVRRSTEPTTMDVYNQSGIQATLENIAANYGTYTLTHDGVAETVTLSGTNDTCKCYVWIDGVEQEAQPDFNPLGTGDDLVLENVSVIGSYIVFAINETTYESGYLEFEVT